MKIYRTVVKDMATITADLKLIVPGLSEAKIDEKGQICFVTEGVFTADEIKAIADYNIFTISDVVVEPTPSPAPTPDPAPAPDLGV